jgi:hypothetical protein
MPNPTLKDKLLNLWFRNQQGADSYQGLFVPPNSRIRFGNQRQGVAEPLIYELDSFPKLPVITTVVATSDQFFLVAGVNAVSADVTQADKGGIRLAAHGADNDQTYVAGVAATRFAPKVTATSQVEFAAQISVGQVGAATAGYSVFGFNETITGGANVLDPTSTTGDGVLFWADTANEQAANHLATAAQAANWIIAFKVAGADTFVYTTVPVQAGIDVVLEIKIGTDRKALCYIDGVLVATGPVFTLNSVPRVIAGIQAGAASAQFVEVRYIACGRQIG